jgi:hypothetical protein
MAGYSETPLLRKLGIKPSHRAVFLDAPEDYKEALGALPEGGKARSRLRGSPISFIFSRNEGRRSSGGLPA